MKSLIISASAVAICLCAPVVGNADTLAPAHTVHHPVHRVAHAAIPAGATALALPVVPRRETDGLSRDRADCNTGCIDN
ncbi:hypothetical protein DFR50_10810 [Roseiarcus fermentans]|uniref:Uncharacterized protein n=1 Tax=Roseiarcus fermentans TaxID=1473586 RepID=A0A366FL89_9HYPH|nr:hypothetical protein [Roseiarcus fermentans]RBP15454.1 hypothetical protein DFR50_10810 [Roseiarcus fermentans]